MPERTQRQSGGGESAPNINATQRAPRPYLPFIQVPNSFNSPRHLLSLARRRHILLDTAVAKPCTAATTIEQPRKKHIMNNYGTSPVERFDKVAEGGGPANKRPRLQKSAKAKAPSTEPDGDPNSLLIIGDALSHMVAYLPVKELCNAEMTCRSLRQLAGPILDRRVDEMNRDWVPKGGKGSRSKLLRYLAVMGAAIPQEDAAIVECMNRLSSMSGPGFRTTTSTAPTNVRLYQATEADLCPPDECQGLAESGDEEHDYFHY